MSQNGFWSVMKRMIVGEPAFKQEKTNNKSHDQREAGQWQDSVLPDDSGYAQEQPSEYRPADGVASSDSSPRENTEQDSSESKFHDARGNKIVPEVEIVSCKTHRSGNNCEVWGYIHNSSAYEIELDKIVMIGTKRELDYRLTPENEREFCLYSGPVPLNDSARNAELYYKLVENGDYFCARHMIEYDYDSDDDGGKYIVEEMKLIRPIRDI